MSHIHPTAIIAPGAQLDESVDIGPYCIVGPQVRLGAGTRLISHVSIDGRTTLGAGCTVYPFASLGSRTQDLKYKGGSPAVEIGDRTVVREYATVNQATYDDGVTRVGSDCLLMAYSHVAHDCRVGNRVILANVVQLAGHVTIEDRAIVGGLVGVHQFVRIGSMAIVGHSSKVSKDVPPYMTADGNPLAVRSLNLLGLKRNGLTAPAIASLKTALQILYRQGLNVSQAVAKIEAEMEPTEEIRHLVEFIRSSERGITMGHGQSSSDDE